MAGLALGVGIYDTQCGAKLFRADAVCAELFEQPFLRGGFSTSRSSPGSVAGRGHTAGTCLEQVVYEYPLESWRDVAGSKLKSSDFFKSFGELARIYWNYLRPGVSSPAVTARLSAAGHLPHERVLSKLPTTAAAEEPSHRAARPEVAGFSTANSRFIVPARLKIIGLGLWRWSTYLNRIRDTRHRLK